MSGPILPDAVNQYVNGVTLTEEELTYLGQWEDPNLDQFGLCLTCVEHDVCWLSQLSLAIDLYSPHPDQSVHDALKWLEENDLDLSKAAYFEISERYTREFPLPD